MTEKYHGHATMADGTHVALSADEVKALIEMADASDKRRREAMPDTKSALRALMDAMIRLRDEGWRDGIYCPKDGSDFAVIEFGSTGMFQGCYAGEWPKGHVMFCDGLTHPRGTMWKPLDRLTDWERETLAGCDEAERQAMDRQTAAFIQMDEEKDE